MAIAIGDVTQEAETPDEPLTSHGSNCSHTIVARILLHFSQPEFFQHRLSRDTKYKE
jgi:hypothetical protein